MNNTVMSNVNGILGLYGQNKLFDYALDWLLYFIHHSMA